MMNKWDYGGAFERHPIQTGTADLKQGVYLILFQLSCIARIVFLLIPRGRRVI